LFIFWVLVWSVEGEDDALSGGDWLFWEDCAFFIEECAGSGLNGVDAGTPFCTLPVGFACLWGVASTSAALWINGDLRAGLGEDVVFDFCGELSVVFTEAVAACFDFDFVDEFSA